MNRIWRAIIFLSFLAGIGLTQASPRFIGKISGTVVDQGSKQPLIGVNIFIPSLRRGTTTDEQGRYELDGLHEGVYTLRYSFVGYATVTRTVVLEDRDIELHIEMSESILQLPSITVTGKPQATDILSMTQSTNVLEEHEIARLRAPTIAQTIEHLAGVSMISTGNGIGKPVIRGLSAQRVVVIHDGVRQEGQQWGDEHAPEIDAYEAEKIEIVRGPGSLLYGSDALGGVVSVVSPDISKTVDGTNKLRAELSLNAFSNNEQLSGSLNLAGASGQFAYRAAISGRTSGDIQTPAGSLFNSGVEELNGNASMAYAGDWGFVDARFVRFTTRLELHENPAEDATATPFQRIVHDKGQLHSSVTLEGVRLEAVAGFQRNRRREFEESTTIDPSLELFTGTFTVDLKAHHRPFGPLFGTVGVSLMRQDVDSRKREKLVPNSQASDLAGFLFEEIHLGQVSLSGGLRLDTRSLDIGESSELGVAAQERRYDAVSGSLGASFRPTENLALVANLSRGFRSPTAFELFANGVHEGTATYEIGEPDLVPERATSSDLSVRYVSPRAVAQATLFRNEMTNYIFSAPTGFIDTSSTFPIFRYRQARAVLQGIELSLNIQLAEWWQVQIAADYTRGENRETGDPLPRIPPGKCFIESQFELESLGPLTHPHLNVRARSVSTQTRTDPRETRTGGYTLFDLSAGFEFPLGDQRGVIHLGIENMFDKAHTDHLNRYKTYALNPGRNFTGRLTIPFKIV